MPYDVAAGKMRFVYALMEEGHTFRASYKIVTQFFKLMADCLARGEMIKIPGLGKLRIQHRKPRRYVTTMIRGGKSLITTYKQPKSVTLKPCPRKESRLE